MSDLFKYIQYWEKGGRQNELILMDDMHECINTNDDLHDFFIKNDLINAMGVLNPILKRIRHMYAGEIG